jgi:uncharacterized membrane protein YsdA (DUF1294 family)
MTASIVVCYSEQGMIEFPNTLSLSLPGWILLGFFGLLNLFTFVLYGVDKVKAQMQRRRISEKTLWLMTLFGGTGGALLGMHFFHHKTRKISFQFILSLILLLQTLIVVGMLWFFTE